MTWIVANLLLALSVSLLFCRFLMEVLAHVEASTGIKPSLMLVVDIGVIVFALLAVAGQMARASFAVKLERQRIAADLHDGLGFHLMTALSLGQETKKMDDDVRMAVELAILELHSVVHFMHSPGVSIVSALASLRYRIQPVLQRQGVQLVWNIDHYLPDEILVGTAAYHFVKIAQEALSNVLQHAHATRLEVTLSHAPAERRLLLEVKDNGCGLQSSAPARSASRGRGLAGMTRRASLLGARLKIDGVQEGGTCISLTVPLPCVAA